MLSFLTTLRLRVRVAVFLVAATALVLVGRLSIFMVDAGRGDLSVLAAGLR